MASKFSSSLINFSLLLLRSGRRYATSASESVKTQSSSAAASASRKKHLKGTGKITENYNLNMICGNSNGNKKEKGFWMRDPRTGYWIPETHFHDVDVADLRHKLLPKKQ